MGPVAGSGHRRPLRPVYRGYLADPYVYRHPDGGFIAVGTTPGTRGPCVFNALVSDDLKHWRRHGPVLERVHPTLGTDYWAPEVAFASGHWWLYYSLGSGIHGHHIRVAVSDSPLGPFRDCGMDLTPNERFAIDPHPFRDEDGSWYLFFARDVLDSNRPGTHLAVAPMVDMMQLGTSQSVLAPNADWQVYQLKRRMYGQTYDWHTLEGPAVIQRGGRYLMTYSGGAWTGDQYAVSWSYAASPLGPWQHSDGAAARLLSSADGFVGPGHNSIFVDREGRDAIAFHAWNTNRRRRQMYIAHLETSGPEPRLEWS